MRQALVDFGGDPDGWRDIDRRGKNVVAYVESHIEQGPVLLNDGLPVGVVTAIAGASRLRVNVDGLAGHAGTVPMGARQDALTAASEMVLFVERHCESTRGLVGTVGKMRVLPGAINVIPQDVEFTIDVRSGDDALRRRRGRGVQSRVRGDRDAAQRRRCERRRSSPPTPRPATRRCRHAFAARDRGARHSGATSAERRRSRRDGVSGRRADRHAVRPLRQQRHQPSSRRDDDRRGRRDRHFGAAAFPRTLRAARTRDLERRMDPLDELDRWIDAHHAEQVEFLREIVRVPSDTPPGDNAPAAEKAAALLTAHGLRTSSATRCRRSSCATTACRASRT